MKGFTKARMANRKPPHEEASLANTTPDPYLQSDEKFLESRALCLVFV